MKAGSSPSVAIPADLNFFRIGAFQDALFLYKKIRFLDPSLHPPDTSRIQEIQKGIGKPNNLSPNANHSIDSHSSLTKIVSELNHFEISFTTSGSTGEPKIFPKTEKELLSEIHTLKNLLIDWEKEGVLPTSKSQNQPPYLVSIPLCHIYGFLWGYALPREMDWEVTYAGSLSQIRKTLLENPPRIWVTVPSQLRGILEFMGPSQYRLSDTLVISSGSRMESELAKKWMELHSVRIREIYGSTETGGIGYRRPDQEDSIQFFPGIQAKIQDECLSVYSDFIHPDIKDRDGFFQTEDTGYLEGGRFFYTGRLGRVVKRNEKRIHLDAVERSILDLDSVLEVAAVSYQEKSYTKIGIFLVLSPGQSEEDYRRESEQLPRHLRPDRYSMKGSIPRLPNGKTDYDSIRKEFEPR